MAAFSGVGTALSSRFVETRAKCLQQALENAFRIGRRLRELDFSKAETDKHAFSKMHFGALEIKRKHLQYDFRA